MKGPPPYDPDQITINDLDFSDFHPLDHWPGTHDCRLMPGGWRRHLDLTWSYRRRDQLTRPWRRLKCKFGHHNFTEVWHREGKEWVGITVCGCGLRGEDIGRDA